MHHLDTVFLAGIKLMVWFLHCVPSWLETTGRKTPLPSISACPEGFEMVCSAKRLYKR